MPGDLLAGATRLGEMMAPPNDTELPQFDTVLPDWFGWTIAAILIIAPFVAVALAVFG